MKTTKLSKLMKAVRCFFGFHPYKTIDYKQCSVQVASLIHGYMGKQPAIASIEFCTACGKMIGQLSCGGTTQKVSLEELAVNGYFKAEGRMYTYGELLAISRIKAPLRSFA